MQYNEPPPAPRPTLLDLPFVPRLVIALFLISVGIGYFSALVQLHFQAARPGKLLPDMDDAARIYNGDPKGKSQLERLMTQDENLPFNGSGSMSAAFTLRSAGWKGAISRRAKEEKKEKEDKGEKDVKLDLKEAEKHLRAERDGERLAVVAWIEAKTPQQAYDDDNFPLPPELAKHAIGQKFQVGGEQPAVKIKTIFEDRCVRCHAEGKGGPASEASLESYDDLKTYCDVASRGHGMSLTKLAQTTHVHLLGFSMLYGLTGLIFAFTRYPGWLRFVLAPLPLIAQVADISCWWLARYDPVFAHTITITGAIVAGGLFLQIVLSLFSLFGKRGWAVLLLLFILGGLGAAVLEKRIITPYLQSESKGEVIPN
jgi:hypothetical protein